MLWLPKKANRAQFGVTDYNILQLLVTDSWDGWKIWSLFLPMLSFSLSRDYQKTTESTFSSKTSGSKDSEYDEETVADDDMWGTS